MYNNFPPKVRGSIHREIKYSSCRTLEARVNFDCRNTTMHTLQRVVAIVLSNEIINLVYEDTMRRVENEKDQRS